MALAQQAGILLLVGPATGGRTVRERERKEVVVPRADHHSQSPSPPAVARRERDRSYFTAWQASLRAGAMGRDTVAVVRGGARRNTADLRASVLVWYCYAATRAPGPVSGLVWFGPVWSRRPVIQSGPSRRVLPSGTCWQHVAAMLQKARAAQETDSEEGRRGGAKAGQRESTCVRAGGYGPALGSRHVSQPHCCVLHLDLI